MDTEKHTPTCQTQFDDDSLSSAAQRDTASRGDPERERINAIRQSNAVLRSLAGLESRIDKFTKFEAMGVERVLEDERRPPQILNVSHFDLWFHHSASYASPGVRCQDAGLGTPKAHVLQYYACLTTV
jgi:hypothetical protein